MQIMKRRISDQWYLSTLIILLLSIAGLCTVLYSTVWGAALSDDSYFYISSARNLLAGKGFDLTPKVPPVLPLLLSAIGIFKVDPLVSIRWVNAILFGLNIYLVARIIFRLTQSRILSILGAFFTLISSTMIVVHSWAMSEPLFITFLLSGILVYTIGYQKDGWKTPLLSGIFFGLAAGTRYIGISFLLAGGIFWLIDTRDGLRFRLRDALIFSVAGGFPLLLWAIRNDILIGQPTSRVFGIHLLPASAWISMLNTILLWILPGRFVNGKEIVWITIFGVVLFAWLLVSIFRNRQHVANDANPGGLPRSISFLIANILSYLFILLISRSFFDERIPMDERLLSPILALGLILITWIFSQRWRIDSRLNMGLIVVLCMVLIGTNTTRTLQTVQSYHISGRGYASARDHISETYAYLRNRPNIPIYSNAFAAVYFWTGRVTYSLPLPIGIPAMKADMHQNGAYLVIFDSIPLELYGTTREQITQGLVEQIRLSEATIYRSP